MGRVWGEFEAICNNKWYNQRCVVNFNNNSINLMNQSSKDQNRKIRRNTIVFGIMMLLSQLAISIIYAATFKIPTSTININSVVTAVALAILVVAGFGLVFSYMKRLVWSGIGFTFFITAFCIELYPLINDFWTKARIDYSETPIYFQTSNYELYLANANLSSSKLYGNCLTNAIKCALAVSVAFSCILGRAGPLQCLFVTVLGTFGFQLNRQIIVNLAVDGFGTYSIFTFGGFMGVAMGFILRLKENRTEGCSTQKHTFNTASIFSVSYAVFGSLIILALFPVLAYQIDVSSKFNIFNLQNGPVSIVIGMGAAIVTSFIMSGLINGSAIIRDIIHAPIAGGIVVGSASFFITNPVYALVAGFAGGAVQTFIQNIIEKPYVQNGAVLSTISWSLFGIQGIIGGVFATGYKRIIDLNSNSFAYNVASVNFNPGYQLLIAAISAGIGLGFGLLCGLMIYIISGHKSEDHFSDKPYWISDDGLTYPRAKEVQVSKGKTPKDGIIVPPPPMDVVLPKPDQPEHVKEQHSQILPLPDIVSIERSEFDFEMEFSEGSELPNNFHAYL